MSRKQVIATLVVVVLGIALFVVLRFVRRPAAYDDEESGGSTVVSVEVGHLGRATLHGYVEGFGNVAPAPAANGRPAAQTRVAASVAGVVTKVFVEEGQTVEGGAPLFELDSRAARVAVDAASQVVERQKVLFEQKNTSQRSLQDAEAQLAAAEAQLALLHITAPIPGIVSRVNVRQGEAVDLTTVLAVITDPNRLVVDASIPSTDVASLAEGQTAFVRQSDDRSRQRHRARACVPSRKFGASFGTVRAAPYRHCHAPRCDCRTGAERCLE